MASSAATENLGLRQQTIDIMDNSFLSQFNSSFHHALMSTTVFVPYSSKEFKDLDIVEFSVLRQFGMLQYVLMLQQYCEHSDEDEFHGNRIMDKQLTSYKPSLFLPKTVDVAKNLNKELISGKDYEEVLYYREVVPYGPTYHIMTLIAELGRFQVHDEPSYSRDKSA
ncbi:hypothetical protein R1sor_002010 [Riccia sorocarpa]|uniref:Uncharacterized protein n=1 Tax=Riccia sorocarpa TaxID=122646 RepID=A0ABD3GXJ9_9MARC